MSRNGRTPWCGGTLISSTHVLTAAHCTDGAAASNIRVLLGEHNIADSVFNRVDVAEIINHPDYDSRTTDNDYAILRLSQAVTFTNEVAPACLPADTGATYAGVLATVTGWGTLSSGGNQPTALQEVDVTVTTNTECNNAYGSITANMICAADSGKDSCQGDSGGPLIAAENGRQALVRNCEGVFCCHFKVISNICRSVLSAGAADVPSRASLVFTPGEIISIEGTVW